MPRNTINYKRLPYNPKLKECARALRKARNWSEVLLWNRLKKGGLDGLDFDRQKIIGNFIVDFYCASEQLVVEIDGASHWGKEDYDARRDEFLQSLGLTVLHISRTDVDYEMEKVLAQIGAARAR
jgi:very-short-patch-repair endonuclease